MPDMGEQTKDARGTVDPSVVEKGARALFYARRHGVMWDSRSSTDQARYHAEARAVLDAVPLVPREQYEAAEAVAQWVGAVNEALGRHRDAYPFVDDAVRAVVDRAEAAEAQARAYREALEQIASGGYHGASYVARKALEGSTDG